MEHSIHLNQIKSHSRWRPYILPKYQNKCCKNPKHDHHFNNSHKNMKNYTNCKVKIPPGIDDRQNTGNLKNTELWLSTNLCFLWGTVDLNKTLENLKWKKLNTNIIDSGSINLILNEGKPYTKKTKWRFQCITLH
jgi:hypothetical protein